jgi:hypothetical protein
MGGIGSGSWDRSNKKSTVEESLVLAMKDFWRRLYHGAGGTFSWTWAGGAKSSIGYFVTWDDSGPTVTLRYRWRDIEDVQIPVRLETSQTQFGGERRWFTCPLIVDGVACNRRIGKLYLPPRARYFGCRNCHGLTYRSCQESHFLERLPGSIDRMERWLETKRIRRQAK